MALFAGNLTRFGGGNLQETAPGNLALFRRKLSVRVTSACWAAHSEPTTSIFHSVGVRVAAIAVCVVSLLAEAAIFKLCLVHFICPLEWRLVFSINFID